MTLCFLLILGHAPKHRAAATHCRHRHRAAAAAAAAAAADVFFLHAECPFHPTIFVEMLDTYSFKC